MNEIRLFGKSLIRENKVNYSELNDLAIKVGYIVHPSCSNQNVFDFLKTQEINYNSTFYKTWNDVTSKNRLEILITQLIHYSTTYGTNFEGEAYIPNNEPTLVDFTTYKFILPISNKECFERCEKILFSGIALKQDTIEMILELFTELKHTVDIDKVKNKEAKMFLYKELKQYPSDPIEMVRYLVYNTTGNTLLIKDSSTINKIKNGTHYNFVNDVENFGYEKLSEVFFRFKPIFLAFRTSKKNNTCINKLRKLADKNHKPLESGYFESLLSSSEIDLNLTELKYKLNNLNNFKKINLLQSINIRLKELNIRCFGIRNGKLFIKEERLLYNKRHLLTLYSTIYQSLIESLKSKTCSISIPNNINITLPTSEKSFIGNYPIGTSFDFSETNNIIGIHWKETDGASDLDLSLNSVDGKKYGWNSHYYNENNSIIFSGDMTSARPEAVELFYTSKNFNPSLVNVNLYRGSDKSKFKFFIANEKIDSIYKNYMVNPNNIVFTVDLEMDSKEKSLGVITENKFILAQFRTGKGRISGDSITNKYTDYSLSTLDCFLDLKTVLTDAGFSFVSENAEIDLKNISKDSLISLFN